MYYTRNSEYDQEIPQSQTNCRETNVTTRESHITITRHQEDKLRKTLSSPSRRFKTRMDIPKRTTKHRTITKSLNGSNDQQRPEITPDSLRCCIYLLQPRRREQSICGSTTIFSLMHMHQSTNQFSMLHVYNYKTVHNFRINRMKLC